METSSLINTKGAGITRALLLTISGNFARRQQIHKVVL